MMTVYPSETMVPTYTKSYFRRPTLAPTYKLP